MRKSGIRIGEVSAIAFDERPNQPDGVIVTLALERRYTLHEGPVPRLTRSLIGDVTIDMLAGHRRPDFSKPASARPTRARSSRATSRPTRPRRWPPPPRRSRRPATRSKSINQAASGPLQDHQERREARRLPDTWPTPARTSPVAQGIERVIKANEANFQPAIASFGEVAEQAQRHPRSGDAETRSRRASTGSPRPRLASTPGSPDRPGLLKDLVPRSTTRPTTDIGQAVRRLNLVLGRPRALDQQAPRRPGRPQHRRQPPEAASLRATCTTT